MQSYQSRPTRSVEKTPLRPGARGHPRLSSSPRREGSVTAAQHTSPSEAAETDTAQVPYRGVRGEDVVVFEVPPDYLADDFRREVMEAVAAASPGVNVSANASLSDASHLGAQGRMWFIGHVVSLDESGVELADSNPRLEEADARQKALLAKVSATEMALDEVVTRRREVEDRFLNLEKARKAVSGISAAEVKELQSYQHPPAGVRRVLEAVLTILGSPVATIAGWPAIRTAVRDPHFLDEVNRFDADSMTPERRDELRARYEQDPLLLSETSGMLAVSVATRSLRTWVNAQLLYDGLDANPYHIRGGHDVARLDSRAHALEEDLHVFYSMLQGHATGAGPDPSQPPRAMSPLDALPAWPVVREHASRLHIPYSWLMCRLDPPVASRTDILPSERQFIDELWGYRIQDPPPSPHDTDIHVGECHAEPPSQDGDDEDEAGVEAHGDASPDDYAEETGALGEPLQVSCTREEVSAGDEPDGGDRVDDDDGESAVEALVDHTELRRQCASGHLGSSH